jgi:hypothetical protein
MISAVLPLVILTALACVACAKLKHWPWRLAAGFLAVNFAAGVLAYAILSPGLFLKRADGRLHPTSWVVLSPLHAANQVKLRVVRALRSDRPFDEIQPGLFLGRRLAGREAGLTNFRTVLDLTSEFTEPEALRGASNYLCLPVLDHTPPTLEQIRQALVFLKAHQGDAPILVHCAFGRGRSALVVAAFLIQQGKATNAADAVTQLQRARPGVKLNSAQRARLEEFARGLAENREMPPTK